MTDETQTEIEMVQPEAPQVEAPAVEEAPVPVIQTPSATTAKIFKPHGEEFSYDVDFAGVAAQLNLSIDQVEFTIVEDAEGNIDGKSLVGTPKA